MTVYSKKKKKTIEQTNIHGSEFKNKNKLEK